MALSWLNAGTAVGTEMACSVVAATPGVLWVPVRRWGLGTYAYSHRTASWLKANVARYDTLRDKEVRHAS